MLGILLHQKTKTLVYFHINKDKYFTITVSVILVLPEFHISNLKPYILVGTTTSFYYHNIYAYQIWQNNNLPWWALTHEVTWPCDHLISRDHVTNEKYYITTTTVPKATKLGCMVTYFKRLPPIKLLNPLVTWSCKIPL